jgi:hypothetical protein
MKRKINMNRPDISSQEIAKRKDFGSVLKQANVGGSGGAGKPFFKKPWFFAGAAIATVGIVAGILLMNKDKEPGENRNPVADNQQPVNTGQQDLEAFYKAEESKPCIHPPIPGLDVAYTVYKVTAGKGAKLGFKTGSVITIPKNAFADNNGNIIKGEVELRYREFHDAADFFVSGIPMTYDSAGTRYQFESAGMVEIQAFQDGRQINMAPGKKVDISLSSAQNGGEYNLYKLDTNINNWSCLGKDKVVAKAKSPAPAPAFDAEKELAKMPEFKAAEAKIAESEKTREEQLAALPKPEAEPRKPQQVKKGRFTEDLDVDYSEFPEIASFKNVAWEVGDENKDFNSAKFNYINSIEWESIDIKEGPKKGENYVIQLTKGLKKETIVVYPVLEGKNYETALADFQEKYKKYQATLDKRIANEKRIEEEHQARILKAQLEEAAARKKFEQREANIFKESSTEEKVQRMFQVSCFGVFNCDNPSAYPRGAMCTANLKGENNRDLRVYDVYLVDKQKNALFTYSKNPVATFSYNPDSRNMIWTVENGVLYWFKPEQFKGMKSGDGMSKLEMNRVDQKFASVDELKTYFGF